MAKKMSSSVRFEIDFYEKVLLNAPDFVEVLACLGELYTRQGHVEKGLAMDLRLSALRPEDPVVAYNLACSYSLLNDLPSARRAMEKAIGLGYDEWDHLYNDPDLSNLLADSAFQSYLNRVLFYARDPRSRVPEGRS